MRSQLRGEKAADPILGAIFDHFAVSLR